MTKYSEQKEIFTHKNIMPFKNPGQMRACFAKERASLKAGYQPKWNCQKWIEEGRKKSAKKKSVSRRSGKKKSVSMKKSGKRRSPSTKKSTKKIYTGPRGGKYVVYKDSEGNKRKVYL
jgi:hypothetical protein